MKYSDLSAVILLFSMFSASFLSSETSPQQPSPYENPMEEKIEMCLLAELFQKSLPSDCDSIPHEIKSYMKWEGTDSHVAQGDVRLVTDSKSWNALWKSHRRLKSSDPVPNVDFSKDMVFAWFVEGLAADSRVVARFADTGHDLQAYTLYWPAQRMVGDPSPKQMAYGIYVIPRQPNVLWRNRLPSMGSKAGFSKQKVTQQN